jgi:two-component system copper resistance phosphate regulon response regulator CusR
MPNLGPPEDFIQMAKLLIAEDDRPLSGAVKEWLEAEKHTVEQAFDGDTALEFLQFYQYDLVVLDWQMPQLSGVELLKILRSKGNKTPILMLTGKSSTKEKTLGLDAGADDYLTKPFQLEELSARVRALLRRLPGYSDNLMKVRDISLDAAARTVHRGGQEVHLAPREFNVLEFLVRHQGQILAPEAILNRVWDSESDAAIDMVRTTIQRIRKKIGDSADESIIKSVYGVGYGIVPENANSGHRSSEV